MTSILYLAAVWSIMSSFPFRCRLKTLPAHSATAFGEPHFPAAAIGFMLWSELWIFSHGPLFLQLFPATVQSCRCRTQHYFRRMRSIGSGRRGHESRAGILSVE